MSSTLAWAVSRAGTGDGSACEGGGALVDPTISGGSPHPVNNAAAMTKAIRMIEPPKSFPTIDIDLAQINATFVSSKNCPQKANKRRRFESCLRSSGRVRYREPNDSCPKTEPIGRHRV